MWIEESIILKIFQVSISESLHATHGSISIIEITKNKWYKPEFGSFSKPKAKKNYRKLLLYFICGRRTLGEKQDE
jgi:hypothetical protein